MQAQQHTNVDILLIKGPNYTKASKDWEQEANREWIWSVPHTRARLSNPSLQLTCTPTHICTHKTHIHTHTRARTHAHEGLLVLAWLFGWEWHSAKGWGNATYMCGQKQKQAATHPMRPLCHSLKTHPGLNERHVRAHVPISLAGSLLSKEWATIPCIVNVRDRRRPSPPPCHRSPRSASDTQSLCRLLCVARAVCQAALHFARPCPWQTMLPFSKQGRLRACARALTHAH